MTRTSRLALAATATLAVLPATAGAAPAALHGGAVSWNQWNVYDTSAPSGTQRTWFGYIAGPLGGGSVTSADGLTLTAPDGTVTSRVDTAFGESGAGKVFNGAFPISSGTVDPAAKTLDAQAAGTITFASHGQPAGTFARPRIVLSGDGSGAVYMSGTGATGALDPATPLFTIDASAATFEPVGGGRIAIGGLVPTLGTVAAFGGAYAPGVAGPNRTPNIFGGFSVLVETQAATPAPSPTPTVVERTVEVPVDRVVERTVQASVVERQVVVRRTLARAPFGTSEPVDVALRRSGSQAVLGEGYVRGARLVVIVPEGTTLAGKYVLRRLSSGIRLKKSATVTLGAAASATRAR